MWHHNNDYENLNDLIDHKVEKEQELKTFKGLLRKNTAWFSFLISFFVGMERFDYQPLRLKPAYASVNVYFESGELGSWDRKMQFNYPPVYKSVFAEQIFSCLGSFHYDSGPSFNQGTQLKEDNKINENRLMPPPNWGDLYPRTSQSFFKNRIGCFYTD